MHERRDFMGTIEESFNGRDAAKSERPPSSLLCSWSQLFIGALLLALIGTWLVWFFSTTQHRIAEEEVRAACQRVMPETAERCFDTVVLQRGGVRR
jgi:hypothetical protein